MVSFVKSKFSNNENPHYIINKIKEGDLEIKRDKAKLKICKQVDGSTKFQVNAFKPNFNSFKAANRLCVCAEFCIIYGSCSLFQEYYLNVDDLMEISLQSGEEEALTTIGADEDSILYPFYICAMAADVKSVNTVWFVKVVDEIKATEDIVHEHDHEIIEGQIYQEGHYWERIRDTKKNIKYKLMNKIVHFFKENIVYPFINFEINNCIYLTTYNEYCDILSYVEHFGMVSL